jgi:hypothetical protein
LIISKAVLLDRDRQLQPLHGKLLSFLDSTQFRFRCIPAMLQLPACFHDDSAWWPRSTMPMPAPLLLDYAPSSFNIACPIKHYQRSCLCRVPATHGERGKAHDKCFAVCLLSANNTRQRTPRRTAYAVSISENPRRSICRVLSPHTRESKAPNAFQTSMEARGGPGVQFAVGLGFAVSLQLEIQVTVCHELEFAVCSTVDSLPWV